MEQREAHSGVISGFELVGHNLAAEQMERQRVQEEHSREMDLRAQEHGEEMARARLAVKTIMDTGQMVIRIAEARAVVLKVLGLPADPPTDEPAVGQD